MHINVSKIDHLPWFNFSGLKSTKILKSTGKTEKESVAMEMQFNYIRKFVTFGTMSVTCFNGFCRKLNDSYIYTGLQITVGHRTMADQNFPMSDKIATLVRHFVRSIFCCNI